MILRFAHPHVLWLLLLLPLWLWARCSPKLRATLHFPSAELFRNLPRSTAERLHPLLHAFAFLGLLLLTLALARPQTGLRREQVHADTVDIVLAVDASTSMRAVDLTEDGNDERNRLDAVKEVADTFIKARKGDRIGLIAFARMPYTVSPLTLDKGWLLQRLKDLEIGELPDGTAVGSALASAVNRLRDSEVKSKVVVLLTDGVNNAGDIEPLQAAKLAESLDVRVYTIGAGAEGLVKYPQTDLFGRTVYQQVRIPIDVDMLTEVAQTTGGRFFRARDNDELEEVFKEIDKLERTEIELTEYTRYTEQFQWFAAAGLGLLMLERLLAAGRLGRATA